MSFRDFAFRVLSQLPRINPKDLLVTQSGYGNFIAQVDGTMRVTGEVIWSAPKVRTYNTATAYSETVSIAFAICDAFDGPIAGIGRVWANGEPLWDLRASTSYETYVSTQEGIGSVAIYKGTASQIPDPDIVAAEGSAPAYRFLAYAKFKTLALSRWNNQLPNLEFEVIPVGSVTDSILYLDTPSLLGINANGSIRPDGLLVVVHDVTSGNNQVHVRNPFTLASVQQISLSFDPPLRPAPVMNNAGDLLTGTKLVRANGVSSDVCLENVGAVVEASGTFVIGGRFGTTEYGVRRINADGSSTILTATPSAAIAGFSYDTGNYYVSWDNPGFNTGLRKINASTGATVLEVTGSGTAAYGFAIAADGSVFYRVSQTERSIKRRSPDFTTVTAVYTDAGFNQVVPHTKLARDWINGGILWFGLGQLNRYGQDGTLLQTITSAGVDGYAADTHPNYQSRVYAWSTFALGNTRHCVTARFGDFSPGVSTVGALYSRLALRAGLTAGEIDVSALTLPHKGSVVLEQASARATLEPNSAVYSVQVIDQGHKLKFAQRGTAAVAAIPADDLVLLSEGEGYPTDEPSIGQESELPLEVAIGYLQVDNSYIANVQYDRRLVTSSKNAVREDYQVAMSNDQAKQLASTRLYLPWINRQRHKFATSRKYAHFEPGDVIDIPLEAGTATVLLTRIRDEGAVRLYEAEVEDAAAFTQAAAGAPGQAQGTAVVAISPTNLKLLDIALLDASYDDYGLTLAAGGFYGGWPGAQLYKSTDGGTAYADTGITLNTASAIGTTAGVLGNFFGGNIFDEGNSVDVVLTSGTLASLTDLQVLAGLMPVRIGEEILGVTNRVLVTGTTYRLTRFLRGRFGTEWATNRHQTGEEVIVLDSAALKNLALSSGELGVARTYKALTIGSDLAFAAAQIQTLRGVRLKPLAPVHLAGGRNASGDIVVQWVRSARHTTQWSDFTDVPLDEPTESYETDFFAGTALTITAITKAADGQVSFSGAHGLSVGASVYLHSIAGMIQLNERAFTVASVPSSTAVTLGENTTGYSAYTSGGSALKRKPSGTVASATPNATYTSAQQTTDYGGTQSNVRVAIQQISARVGRGYSATASI